MIGFERSILKSLGAGARFTTLSNTLIYKGYYDVGSGTLVVG